MTHLKKLIVSALSFFLILGIAKAQSTTFTKGSYIINMGLSQTEANALKPYGLIYDLLKNYKVPVYWVINQSKIKDGIDFTYNGVPYKGGTFIVAKGFITDAVRARFAAFGLQTSTTSTDTVTPSTSLTVDVTYILKAAPRWTLDDQNGAIAAVWFSKAGIPSTAYNWKNPSALGNCDDIFVMPHADPTWATHSNLYTWNRTYFGSIWAGCHAVSVLENLYNPSSTSQQMNFLANNVGSAGNALVYWTDHAAASPPYTHQYPTAGAAQYMGVTDGAQTNGSEQVFLPKLGGSWRSTTKLIAYDPTQANVPTLSPGPAAIIAWGRAFGNNNYGWVMYEAGHNIAKASNPENIAAQRAFWDFSFISDIDKTPFVSATSVPNPLTINTANAVTVTSTSPIGSTLYYAWSATLNGTAVSSSLFASPTSATTTFRPTSTGNYVVTCTITDACGHITFESKAVVVPSGPTANADALTINPGCGGVNVGSINILSNDVDASGGTLNIVNNSVQYGTPSSPGLGTYTVDNTTGVVTFTVTSGVTSGTQTLTYSAHSSNGGTDATNGLLTITIGSTAPTVTNESFTVGKNKTATFSVTLASGVTINRISTNPNNGGSVSINTAGTAIDYVPGLNIPASGTTTETFSYEVIRTSDGVTNTATVTVTINDEGCGDGKYLSGTAAPALVSGNGWSHVYTKSAGADPASSSAAYTVNSGTNRLLVVGVEVSVDAANTAPTTKTVTWGGKSLTFLSSNPSAGNRVFAYLYYLKESDIASASGTSLAVTMGGSTIYGFVTFAAVYENVDQTQIVRNGASLEATTTTSTTASTTANFTAGDQGIFLAGFGLNAATAAAYSSTVSGWTGSSGLFAGGTVNPSGGNNDGAFYGGIGTRNATGAASGETVSMTVNVAERTSMSIVSLIPGNTCPTVTTRGPMANPDFGTAVNGGSPISITVGTNDYFVSGATYSVTSSPSVGTLGSFTGSTISYTPPSSGALPAGNKVTFTYTVTNNSQTDVGLVTVTLTNGPIVANNDAPTAANSGVTQTVTVTGNDSDPEGVIGANTHVVTITTQPTHGTASVNGSKQIVYVPTTGYYGTDVLTYTLCEPTPSCGQANCDDATVTFTINNQPPPNPGTTSVNVVLCSPKTITLIILVADPEGSALTLSALSAISDATKGTLVNNNDGTVTFTPAIGAATGTGVATFTFSLSDGVNTVNGTVSLNFTNPGSNSAPVAYRDRPDAFTYNQDLYYDVRENDYDPDGQDLSTPSIVFQPTNGTVTIESSGLIKFHPTNGTYFSTDQFGYRIYDMVVNTATCALTPTLSDTAFVYLTLLNTPIQLSGTVYNDVNGVNGSPTNTIDGVGMGSLTGTPLYVYLVNGSGNIVDAAQVNENGTYLFNNVAAATYSIRISPTLATVGAAAPSLTLPSGWVNTGENNGTTYSGTVDGIIPSVVVTTSSISTLNFGVEQLATPSTITAATASAPASTNQVSVASTLFAGSDPSTSGVTGSISSIRVTAFPTNATTVVINGTSYTSGTFPGGGVTLTTNSDGSLATGQTITVDPSGDAVEMTVTIPYKVTDLAGFESTASGSAILPYGNTLSITGRVYNDVDGISSTGVDNLSGLGNPQGVTLYANLINGSNSVVATVAVSGNGVYTFSSGVVASTTYTVQIGLNQGVASSAMPTTLLPDEWVNTGEKLGTGAGGTDGTPNGLLSVTVSSSSISNANFGIEKLPSPLTQTAASVVNPGGTNTTTVPASVFGATDEYSGTIASIRITSFPTNATTISINGTSYTASQFASAGSVTVPTNSSGQPTQTILIDPIDGAVTSVISYKATDYAGKESATTGVANIPFFTVGISGTVLDDADGLKDNLVDGTGKGNPSSTALYAYLLNGSSTILAKVTVNADGTYSFPAVDPGTYSVQVSSTSKNVSETAIASTLPAGWVNTGENLGISAGSDGTANGILTSITVASGDIINANFGIDNTPTAYNKTYSALDPAIVTGSGNSNYSGKISLSDNSGNNDGAVNSSNPNIKPGKLSGSDTEDGLYAGATGSSLGRVVLTQLPLVAKAVLVYKPAATDILLIPSPQPSDPSYIYWNSSTAFYEIPKYSGSLLSLFLKPGTDSVSFKYAFKDTAGIMSNLATYTIIGATPLPVKLLNFDAIKLNAEVLTQWVTATEINNSHFDLQRSVDTKNWITLGTVFGNGNSNSNIHYSFVDTKPFNGINYYRLNQVDHNGVSEYSDIRWVNFDKEGNNNAIVYPNPTDGIVTVSMTNQNYFEDVTIKIFDMAGRVVFANTYTETINNKFEETINLKDLEKGFYQVTISNSSFTKTVKVLKL